LKHGEPKGKLYEYETNGGDSEGSAEKSAIRERERQVLELRLVGETESPICAVTSL
jgi:hypothetical protein